MRVDVGAERTYDNCHLRRCDVGSEKFYRKGVNMPVREETVLRGYCDIEGCDGDGAVMCAACDRLICGRHSLVIQFEYWGHRVQRFLCPHCYDKIKDVFEGNYPWKWRKPQEDDEFLMHEILKYRNLEGSDGLHRAGRA